MAMNKQRRTSNINNVVAYDPLDSSIQLTGYTENGILRTTSGDGSVIVDTDSISDGITSGGIVTWSGTGLTYNISPCTYIINGQQYKSPSTNVTLSASDATYDRIDVFAVNTSNQAVVITGTPSANPQEPQTDPSLQIQLTNVTVTAASTTPSGITTNMIYDENVESWTKSNSSLTVDYANTTTPFSGVYCTLATTTAASTFKALSFYKISTFTNKSDYNALSFAIKLNQALLNTESIKIIFQNTSLYPNTTVAQYSIKATNSLGFNISSTSGYQQINIPLSSIAFSNNSFNFVQIQIVTSRTGISFRLDKIFLQGGVGQPTNTISSNSFGFVNGSSGSATATVPTDTLSIIGTGLATTSATGKTLTISVPSPASGTINYISKFTPSGSLLGNSQVFDNGTTVSIGTVSPLADNKLQVEGRITANASTTSGSSSVYAVIGSSTATYAAGTTLSGNVAVNGTQGSIQYNFGGNATIPNSVPSGSIIAVSGIQFNGAGTVTHNQAGTGIRSLANIFAMWTRTGNTSGTVSHVSNLRLVAPYSGSSGTLTITNYYGVIVEDSSQFAPISITNKWGVYQEGSGDNNYFAGKVLIGSSTVGVSKLNITGLPTSSAGLASGDVWNDGGTLKIV